MKVFIVVIFLASISFIEKYFTKKIVVNSCTDCWSYADGAEHVGGGYDSWIEAYDYCIKHLDPCADDLDEAVIVVE